MNGKFGVSLLDELRRSKIAGPASDQFDLVTWQALASRDTVTAEELDILKAGTFIRQTLEQLRAGLGVTCRQELSAGVRILSVVAGVNRECLAAEAIHFAASEQLIHQNELFSVDLLASPSLEVNGGTYNADEILESIVDAGEALLRLMPPESANAKPASVPALADVMADLNLASAHSITADIWMDVLWRQVRVQRTSEGVVFRSENVDAEVRRAISLYRHSNDMHWNAYISRDHRPATNALEWFTKTRTAERRVSVPSYYASRLEVPGPLYPHLTLKAVMKAFDNLAVVAEAACQRLNDARALNTDETPGVTLDALQWACVYERSTLIEFMGNRTGLTAVGAEELLDFLTFGCQRVTDKVQPHDDVWSAPLVALRHGVGPGEACVALMVHPLRHGGLLRLTDIWLQRLGFDLDFRGTSFEAHCRARLVELCDHSSLASHARVFARDFKFVDTDGKEQQIDLLLVIGDKLVVGEIKCLLAPHGPMAWTNHAGKITKAVHQALCRISAIRRSLPQFLARARQLGCVIPDKFEPLPMVLLNHAIGTGQTVNEVPVVDLQMLETFFNGRLRHFEVFHGNESVEQGPEKTFYANAEDAAGAFAQYLRHPPQLARLQDKVITRLFPTSVNETEPPLFKMERFIVDGAAVFHEAMAARGD